MENDYVFMQSSPHKECCKSGELWNHAILSSNSTFSYKSADVQREEGESGWKTCES